MNVLSVDLISMFGKRVKTQVNESDLIITIDIRDLTKGAYLVKTNTDRGMFINKIIIQ